MNVIDVADAELNFELVTVVTIEMKSYNVNVISVSKFFISLFVLISLIVHIEPGNWIIR